MDHQRKHSTSEASSHDLLLRDTSPESDLPSSSRWQAQSIDEAMEGIIHPKTDKFSINELRKNDKGYTGAPKFDEDDYQMHRTSSYQHHQPLQRFHHHKRRPSQILLGGDDDDEEPEEAEDHENPSMEKTSPENTGGSGGGGREDVGGGGEPRPEVSTPLLPPMKNSASDMAVQSSGSGKKFRIGGSVASIDVTSPLLEEEKKKGSGSDSSKPGSVISLLERPLRPSLKKQPSLPTTKLTDKASARSLFFSRSHDGLASETILETPLLSGGKDTQAETLVSERAGAHLPDPKEPEKAKVKFQLGEEDKEEDADPDGSKGGKHQCHKERHENHGRHHHHHHSKRHPRRQRLGSDVETDNYFLRAVEPEEAEMLPTADLEDIASRRFEDPKGIRRHKIQAKSSVSSFIHLSRKDGNEKGPLVKKLFDHKPHEIFVELDELLPGDGGDDLEWRETARWIKYEENVQEGTERWGKPHVASLSFHSLLSLRKCLEQGTVLLDLEERDLAGIAYKVVENMVITDQLHPDNRGAVMRALLLRHRHVHERSFAQFAMRRNNSGYGSLNLLSHDKKSPKLIPANGSFPVVDKNGRLSVDNNSKLLPEIKITLEDSGRRPSHDMEKIFRNSSTDDLPHMDTNILRRIPEGAEATTVLVGALDFLEQPTIAFVRLASGLTMPNLMEVSIPVRFLFVLLGPINTDLDYHEIGRSISTLMANSYFHDVAYKAEDRKDLLRAINEFLDDSLVLPPGDWERQSLLPIHDIRRKSMEIRNRKRREEIKAKVLTEPTDDELEIDEKDEKPPSYDPLKRSGCLFGGLMNDIKQRYPWYVSDLLDGFNAQCIAAAIFIYFAALSGAITFGGLMGDKTSNMIGVSETLIVTSVCGCVFALLAGQPLIIIGATGPLLLYDEILYNFCKDNAIEYLPMRVWIGFWFGLITTGCVAFEGSSLVRFFTRFTQEIFASLISLLYIYECIDKVVIVFRTHPLLPDYCNLAVIESSFNSTSNETFVSGNRTSYFDEDANYTSPYNEAFVEAVVVRRNEPNTALLSLILTIGTFFIAYFLRQFRNSKFLGRSARRALGDFGVPIAMILMVTLGYLANDTYTKKLSVPTGLTPSNPAIRGWLISPFGLEKSIAVWHVFAAAVAALLLFILVFLETQICELIMFKKDRKLKKGSGFHLDLLLLGYLQVVTGIVGGPWLCAATVRSVSHLASLTVMSRTHAPGQAPYVTEVKEQRLTSFLVAAMIGISVLMAPLLRQVPVACLFGVFLYMGISSMSGIQLFDRMYLLFMPNKHHPDVVYVRKVRTWKMHAYTLIQLLSLGVLWVVKSTEAALAFPFVLLMMVPLRLQLKCFFTPRELQALDGENPDQEEKEEEPDFYQQIVP